MENSKPSKSARKREYLALQELGERLIALPDERIDEILSDDDLRDAIVEAKSIRSRSALRRQKQLIGKLMRDVDPEPIRCGLELATRDERAAREVFRTAEDWRDRLIAERADSVRDFCVLTGTKPDELDGLLKQYHASRDDASRKRIGRQIFRTVRDQLQLVVQKESN